MRRRHGDDHAIGRGLPYHLIEAVSRVGGYTKAGIGRDGGCVREPSRVRFAQGHQSAVRGVRAEQRLQKSVCPMAQADDCVSPAHARCTAATRSRRMPRGIASPWASIRSSTIARICLSVSTLDA